MKLIKIKNRPIRLMANIVALLAYFGVLGVAICAVAYGVGLISPLTDIYTRAYDLLPGTIESNMTGGCATLAIALGSWSVPVAVFWLGSKLERKQKPQQII